MKIQERLTSNWIDFLSVQETKIDGSFSNTQFHVDAYNLFPRDRTKGGSGIAVLIWDTIVAPERNKTANNKNLSWSTCNRPRNVVLISAYKPPSIDNISFTSELITLLDNPFCITENVIFIGNLNCDILNPLHNNEQGKCLLDICDVYDLASLITSPTRISKNTAPCLDVFLTNVPVFI